MSAMGERAMSEAVIDDTTSTPIGQLKSRAPFASQLMTLPPPTQHGGTPFVDLSLSRQTLPRFTSDELSKQQLSDLLSAAYGVNRRKANRSTSSCAMPANEIAIYVALRQGLYRYNRSEHALHFVLSKDVRHIASYQDIFERAPLCLILVANHARMTLQPAEKRDLYTVTWAGEISHNVDLHCGSTGLATVARGWFERSALAQAMRLTPDHSIILTQTVGLPGIGPVPALARSTVPH